MKINTHDALAVSLVAHLPLVLAMTGRKGARPPATPPPRPFYEEALRREDLADRDISPDYVCASHNDQRVLRLILRHEATPEAIREFCRQRNKLSDYTYWFTLGTLWVSYTGFSNLDLWKRLFASDRPNRETSLMKPSEYEVLQCALEEITLFRAHRTEENDWIAYTLNPATAARFAIERGVKKVDQYLVRREDIFALFLRRGEEEALVMDKSRVRHVGTIPIIDP